MNRFQKFISALFPCNMSAKINHFPESFSTPASTCQLCVICAIYRSCISLFSDFSVAISRCFSPAGGQKSGSGKAGKTQRMRHIDFVSACDCRLPFPARNFKGKSPICQNAISEIRCLQCRICSYSL